MVDVLSNYLIEKGANGSIIDEDMRSGLHAITVYYDIDHSTAPSGEDIASYYAAIKGNFPDGSCEIICSEIVPGEDWLDGWKKNFKPLHVTNQIVIKPSWEDYLASPGEIVIIIDPKMAFGTGHHETTAQCLKALEQNGCAGKRVLDYGCGTGVLAIAAAKLGAKTVIAVDNDPEAIDNARENAVLNNINMQVVLSDDFVAGPPVDIILANLITDRLIRLYDNIYASLCPNGIVIFSGISLDDRRLFLEFLKNKPLAIEEELTGAEWISIVCRKSG